MRRTLAIALVMFMILSGPAAALLDLDPDIDPRDDRPVVPRIRARPSNVIDPALEEALSSSGPGDTIEAFVRFRGGIGDDDLDILIDAGLRAIRTFDFVDAVYVSGVASAIRAVAGSERVQWMEHNEPLEYFMDESTTTINASKVWNTGIIDAVGKEYPGIDGTGVTAVVLDSGIDAGHPDLDYREKVIMNLKSDSDAGWVEVENSDTSSGHGTHCAGTVAGLGDASAGARRGVAPGAKLIGLSTGEAVAILNAVGALEWVYEHTRPSNNPYNIRVVSNSWGTSSDYNPDDVIVIASQKITYENNVVVVFAAGNAGENDHDGSTVTTNPYSLTPSVLSIAAMERDGSGVAVFSSRGSAMDNFTWPDFGAPGVKIWATEARKTLISAMRKQASEDSMDAYYMAISGTSMATPHISGVVALLFQAAPSLRVSDVHDDSMENDTAYWDEPNTRIHEVEWILKATARYVNATSDNGVPDNNSIGLSGKANDFAQGYGLVQVDEAIALALTLENLRFEDQEATVEDALKVYRKVMVHNMTARKTNTLEDNWFGDWSRLNDGSGDVFATTTHDIAIPNGTSEMDIVLNYIPSKSDGWTIGEVTVTIDKDGDGNADWNGGADFSSHGYKEWTIPVDGTGIWSFNVVGQAVQIPDWWRWRQPGDNEYNEVTIEYTIGIRLMMEVPGDGGNLTLEPWDFHARNGILKWGPHEDGGESNCTGGCTSEGIVMETYWYDLRLATLEPERKKDKDKAVEVPMWAIGLVLVLLAVGALLYMRSKGKGPLAGKARGRGGGRSSAAIAKTVPKARPKAKDGGRAVAKAKAGNGKGGGAGDGKGGS